MVDRTLAEVGEVELVDRIVAVLGRGESVAGDNVRVGPGDDAAVLRCAGDVVVTTDNDLDLGDAGLLPRINLAGTSPRRLDRMLQAVPGPYANRKITEYRLQDAPAGLRQVS